MTRKEWLDIGYDKGIIDCEDYEEVTFASAYRLWFSVKCKTQRESTVDRIEVTYRKHLADNPIIEKCISKITDADIIALYMEICTNEKINHREIGRITQIVKGVLVYARDINIGNCPLHDWEKIRRNIPEEKLETVKKKEHAISKEDVEYILKQVIDNKVYETKQSACLCVCMNFYLGLRIGELSALRFDDFDLERNVVRITRTETKYCERDENGQKIGGMKYKVVNHTKTENSTRTIPLVPEVIYIYNLIKEHHKQCGYDSEYLAYDGAQTILSRSIDRTIRKLVSLCETMYFSSHGIRKTFATNLHYNNVPTRVIGDILGHVEISTTEKCYILNYENDSQRYSEYLKSAINYTL